MLDGRLDGNGCCTDAVVADAGPDVGVDGSSVNGNEVGDAAPGRWEWCCWMNDDYLKTTRQK